MTGPGSAQDNNDNTITWMVPGHGGIVSDIDISRDGSLWASASIDGTVKWGAIGHPHFHSIFLDNTYPTAIRVSQDQQWVVWGDILGRVNISAFHPEDEPPIMHGTDGTPVQAIAFLGEDGPLIAGTSGPECFIISPIDGIIRRIIGPVTGVRDFQTSPDGARLSILARDGSASLWDTTEATNPTILFIDPGPYTGALLTSDSRWVFAHANGTLTSRLMHNPGAEPVALDIVTGAIHGLWQDPSGNYPIALTTKGCVHPIGRPIIPDHALLSEGCSDLAIHPSGRMLTAHRNSGQIQLVDLNNDQPSPVTVPVSAISGRIHGFSRSWIDGQKAVLSGGPSVFSIDPLNGSLTAASCIPTGWAGSIAWGQSLLLANGQNPLRALHVSDMEWRHSGDSRLDHVHLVISCPSGTVLAAAGGPEGAHMAILSPSLKQRYVIELPSGPVSSMAFSADSKCLLIATAGKHPNVYLHTMATRSSIPVWAPAGPVRAITSHPSIARFVLAIADPESPHVGTLDLSGFPRSYPSPSIVKLPSEPISVSYAPGGSHLLVGTIDHLLVHANNQTIASFGGELSHVSAIGFHTDGKTVLLGRTDGTIIGVSLSSLIRP
ncbi:MAG: WD40 repeat domain-containing protein [Opitutales bacterium]|nr:WD40 repeat domain-containing protein [Opitutales bacterium]